MLKPLIATFAVIAIQAPLIAQSLEQLLQQKPVAAIAVSSRDFGDAKRGAVLFHQATLACNKCHATTDQNKSLIGPSLLQLDKATSDEQLIESILFPSKSIKKGFESIAVLKQDGQIATGRLLEQTDALIRIADATSQSGELQFSVAEVEEVKTLTSSLMPSGLANQLSSEQQFYDLIKYLIEVRDFGSARASELQPNESLLAIKIPEYESTIDHAGIIRSWDKEALARGTAIYRSVCQSCHGTQNEYGSLPTSLRFGEGKFKNGSDPYSMYQTLTHGFGLMTAQPRLVPTQKYDVIHYIRETFLRHRNKSQFVAIDETYLSKLPKGDSFGPEPFDAEPWRAMNYGSMLANTYEVPGDALNIAYKGIAIQLDNREGGIANGKHWALYDTDTMRMACMWSTEEQSKERFVDWRGIQFNGEHNIHMSVVGDVHIANKVGPGWASPAGSFEDSLRVLGRDGRRYGPLPANWLKFLGTYRYKDQVILNYSVQGIDVLESPRLIATAEGNQPTFCRLFAVKPTSKPLQLRVCDNEDQASVQLLAANTKVSLSRSDVGTIAHIPPNSKPTRFAIAYQIKGASQAQLSEITEAELELESLTKGGPALWNGPIATQISSANDDKAFAVDTFVTPETNPWQAQVRLTGLDFLSDGRLAVCTWDGDVWLVKEADKTLIWKRIACGLFQPLGLRVIRDEIYLTCRDQLAKLHDLNNDEEIDYIECVNNDHQVTEHFHEFAMGLQTDDQGNFYYAKSARHALPAIVPHHGTLLRIAADGSKTDILANGFRAANGVCLNPDGSFVVTDQEGHWNPKNRINWVTVAKDSKPKFYGNMLGYHDHSDSSDESMEQPLCWITNSFDRSPAELLWVKSSKWGRLNDKLLNLSYGYGKVYVVPFESIDGQVQGGMAELPLPQFPTGIIRGRFSPFDEQLYVCGMFSWAGNQTQPGGLYRIRATGQAMDVPIGLHTTKHGIQVVFSDALDPNSIDKEDFSVKVWSLKRSENYGSQHLDERYLTVSEARLMSDNQTVELLIEGIIPTWCMEIQYTLRTASGHELSGRVHNTIHKLGR